MKAIALLCLVSAALAAAGPSQKVKPVVHMVHADASLKDDGLLVVGGDTAVPNAYPYQVSLQAPVGTSWFHFCGGSIIGPNKVVTAAHCIDTGLYIPSLRVVAGEHDIQVLSNTEQIAKWQSAEFHPNYDLNTIDWDFGVITIVGNFTFNQYVQPIYLADTGTVPSGNCVASGWGYDTPTQHQPNLLQKIELPYVPRDSCVSQYEAIGWDITERMICAGGLRSRSICQGDSGGPLACTGPRGPYLAGISSYVMEPCGENLWPDGFANVAFAREWLLSH